MNTLDKTIFNVKLDKTLKQDAQALADELGLPLSTIVIANLKEFVRSRSVVLSALPRLNTQVEAELKSAMDDYRQGKHVSPVFSDADTATDYLNRL